MNNWRIGLVAAIASLSLVACKGTGASGSTGSTPNGSSAPAEQTVRNSAPFIAGAPATTVTAGTTYLAQAIASDSDGDALTYSATGLPAWATIHSQTGQLSGTPSASDVGTTASIVVSVSDGRAMASLPAFQIVVVAAGNTPANPPANPGQNSVPTISGTPTVSVVNGTGYSFAPAASDPAGGTLGFSISGKPAWATFNVSTGALTGTAQAGTYANIVISVSNGTFSSALPAFSLTVGTNTGTASLSWTAPAQNTDGSPLIDLAGYKIYHGTSATALDEVIELPGANNSSHAFSQLTSGTHYFAVVAYNSAGFESALSAVGSKTIL